MSQSNSEMHLTRRAALALGGGTAAGLLLPGGTTALAAAKGGGLLRQSGRLPSLKDLEGILHAEGELSEGLAHFSIGDVPLKPQELNPFIDALLANDLTFQAMHQHYFDLRPMYWFIHFRGV